jgi:hypothetical protein
MRTFIASLDWGLGHTTRILPIIQQCLDNDDEVILGATPTQRVIYEEFFPEITILHFSSSSPHYSKNSSQVFSLLRFIPSFITSIFKEHFLLKKIIKKYQVEKVISDNRYGLFNKGIHSVFITHQINIQLPAGLKGLKHVVNYFNRTAINRFSECWIPDSTPSKGTGYCGNLSIHTEEVNVPIKYIGILSRFSLVIEERVEEVPELLVLISGPEKQRTIFETRVISAIENYPQPIRYMLIRGLPTSTETIPNALNHCKSSLLKTLIKQSKYILCRSGYSTIMDLAYLQRKATLVPTPGQTEQEYLARYLAENKNFQVMEQNSLDLNKVFQSGQ